MILSKERWGLFGLLGLIFLINLFSMKRLTMTYDEPNHLDYGRNALKGNFDREALGVNGDSKMPVSALNAIPVVVLEHYKEGPTNEDPPLWLRPARLITVLFSMLLGFFVFRWAKELYGSWGAFLSLFLYTFSPNIIAHSQLITTDLPFVCLATISTYYFYRCLVAPSLRTWILAIVSVSLAQLTKYSAVLLYPIFGLMAVIFYAPRVINLLKESSWNSVWRGFRKAILVTVAFLGGALLFIHLGFVFDRTLAPLGSFSFRSDGGLFLAKIAARFPNFPVPIPYAYLHGLDWVRFNERNPALGNMGLAYLFGNLSPDGFPGYFFIVTLLKEPLAIQVLVLIAAIIFIKQWSLSSFRERELFLFIPIIFFGFYLNFFFKAHIGIRYFLVVFPFLYIFCGSLFKKGLAISVPLKVTVSAMIVYLVGSVASFFPHYISYVNEILWDRKMIYRYVGDSNIDWGQSQWYIEEFLEKNPDVTFEPSSATPGRVLVGINSLIGIMDRSRYQWLRESFVPIGHVAYSTLLFEISSSEKFLNKEK